MKASKKLIIIFSVTLIVAGFTLGGILLHAHITYSVYQVEVEAMLEAERQEHRARVAPYIRLHYAFGIGNDPGEDRWDEVQRERIYTNNGRYLPPREIAIERNQWGIDVHKYQILLFYKNETGIWLTYELVTDYFAEEFEPDGSLRLYNNRNHPEIEAFVTWMWEGRRRENLQEFVRQLDRIFSDYFFAHRDEGFENRSFRKSDTSKHT